MPWSGPTSSARSSLVAKGLPTRRSRMFIEQARHFLACPFATRSAAISTHIPRSDGGERVIRDGTTAEGNLQSRATLDTSDGPLLDQRRGWRARRGEAQGLAGPG